MGVADSSPLRPSVVREEKGNFDAYPSPLCGSSEFVSSETKCSS